MSLFSNIDNKARKSLPGIFFNKYFLVFCFFIVWITIFDKYKVFNQIHLKNRVSEMEARKYELIEEIENLKIRKEDIELNKEKYAREQFLMHRPDEDVFIIKKD